MTFSDKLPDVGSMRDRPADPSDTLHARLLRGFDDLVAELGGTPERSAAIRPSETVASYRTLIRTLERAAVRLGCPDLGLRLARRQRGGGLGPLSRVMRHSRTLGDALAYVADHGQAHSHAARVWIEPRPGTRDVFVGHDVLLSGLPERAQAMEQILLLGCLGAIDMTAGAARARSVHFRHRPLSPRRVYRQQFGCEVRFGQADDGVVFGIDDLACAIVDTDIEAYRAATAYVERRFPRRERPSHLEARRHILKLLRTDRCDTVDVAGRMALHPRTLHRRLRAEGTSFQRVKDEVRRDVLTYYLTRTRIDLTAIAERLGFAEQSVMTRYCRQTFGAPPSALRRRWQSTTASGLSEMVKSDDA